MDSSDKERTLFLTIEAALLVFAACMSLSLGFLVGPWLGFLCMALLALAFVAVLGVSYARSTREAAADAEVDQS